ncbi:MAG: hypothetical protein KBD01_08835 [Acidobacteria bacterium]|nr:hypothetical protein [Acidobacteriota bacterium]
MTPEPRFRRAALAALAVALALHGFGALAASEDPPATPASPDAARQQDAPPADTSASAAPQPAATTAAEPAIPLSAELMTLRQSAVEAYNRRDWNAAATAADSFAEAFEAAGLPHLGADYALVAFVGGHARYELWKADPEGFRYDFPSEVIAPMEESLTLLQDAPFFKYTVLGTAQFDWFKARGYHDADVEDAANWNGYRALLARADELQGQPLDSQEYETFARHVLQYIARAFEAARYSSAPDVYLIRVREACRLGFGTAYDDRFVQLYQVVGFDDGNVRAGVLWQAGLDMMSAEAPVADEVLKTFNEAAEVARSDRAKAEVYRQMADFSSRQDGYTYKAQAVEYGRTAYRLDPENKDIRLQFGTSLHVLSYADYASGRYEDALRSAQEATSFDWDGNEYAYFDLSRALANFGEKHESIKNAQLAYDKARRRYDGDELEPFRTNYANVLRQFGLSTAAARLEREAAARAASVAAPAASAAAPAETERSGGAKP